ncbi:hypothetical protein FBU30_009972 [Linnemannia zychae]|nr:hypothetical protein FBU30_009972 [Linnemannia zychae]
MSNSIPIPNISQACLASDSYRKKLYLIGSTSDGSLDVYTIDYTNLNEAQLLSSYHNSTLEWIAGSRKACFGSPSPAGPNSPIDVFQFGDKTVMGVVYPNGTIIDPWHFPQSIFTSPNLFSWSGNMLNLSVYLGFTKYSFHGFSNWAAVRRNSSMSEDFVLNRNINHFPSLDPLLALGTFAHSDGNTSPGYTIVIDKANQAFAYQTSTNPTISLKDGEFALSLGSSMRVEMNGIQLTSNAIPITVWETGYILDRAKDNVSVVVYSINPTKNYTLQQVTTAGPSPPFHTSMAAVSLDQNIFTYVSPENGPAYINTFNINSGTWIGNNLIQNSEKAGGVSIGAIVGGVLGALFLIGIGLLIFIRRCRQQRCQQKPIETHRVEGESDIPERNNIRSDNFGDAYYMPAYPLPPHFISPPPPFTPSKETPHYRTLSYESDLTVPDPPSNLSHMNPYSISDSQKMQTSQMVPQHSNPSNIEPRKSNSSISSHNPQYIPSGPIQGSVGRPPQTILDESTDLKTPNSP